MGWIEFANRTVGELFLFSIMKTTDSGRDQRSWIYSNSKKFVYFIFNFKLQHIHIKRFI